MNKKKKFLLILLYIVFLIGLFEGLARLTYSNPKLSKRLWVNENLSWRRSWVQRHKSTGKEIYYTFDNYDSSKGWLSKPNLRDMKVFDNKILNTNTKGVRGINEYSYIKDPNKTRILILGDSYTFGEEVSDNETYSYYLQQLLPNTEVINLGIHGYGHDQMLIYLREEGIKYKPDIIILGFIHPDMKRNMVNFRDYAKPKFKLKGNRLKLTASPVPSLEKTLKWDWARPRIFDVIANFRYKFRMQFGLYEKEKDELTTAILNEIITQSDSINAIPIFVYLPLIKEIAISDSITSGEKYLSNLCENNKNANYFSARQYLIEQLTLGVPFKERGHWGYVGNHAIAEAIKQYLIDSGLVPIDDNNEKSDISNPNKMHRGHN